MNSSIYTLVDQVKTFSDMLKVLSWNSLHSFPVKFQSFFRFQPNLLFILHKLHIYHLLIQGNIKEASDYYYFSFSRVYNNFMLLRTKLFFEALFSNNQSIMLVQDYLPKIKSEFLNLIEKIMVSTLEKEVNIIITKTNIDYYEPSLMEKSSFLFLESEKELEKEIIIKNKIINNTIFDDIGKNVKNGNIFDYLNKIGIVTVKKIQENAAIFNDDLLEKNQFINFENEKDYKRNLNDSQHKKSFIEHLSSNKEISKRSDHIESNPFKPTIHNIYKNYSKKEEFYKPQTTQINNDSQSNILQSEVKVIKQIYRVEKAERKEKRVRVSGNKSGNDFLKKFKHKNFKREIIDKVIIRRFMKTVKRLFLRKDRQSYYNEYLLNDSFVEGFKTANYLPPIQVEGHHFKSFNFFYLTWLFSNPQLYIMYRDFSYKYAEEIKLEIDKNHNFENTNSFIVSHTLYYIENMNKIYNSNFNLENKQREKENDCTVTKEINN